MRTPGEDAAAAPLPRTARRGPIRRLYDWTLSWADRPSGPTALFALSFAESSFFPIPPDVLLMALALGRPRRALWFATICTIASVVGGVAGYFIGMFLFEQIGRPVMEFYGLMPRFDQVGQMYKENLVFYLGTAALTPVPYKVFTIAGGAFEVPLLPFIVVSIVGRGLRFYAVAALIYFFGPPIKAFIDKYFNLLTVVFTVLLVGGFLAIKYLSH